ncbi:hypothetical protein PINS_up006948 [Pythium insidiosum]|nr:hypothetical protein PINS_up006948 [Pythium insidiosum]
MSFQTWKVGRCLLVAGRLFEQAVVSTSPLPSTEIPWTDARLSGISGSNGLRIQGRKSGVSKVLVVFRHACSTASGSRGICDPAFCGTSVGSRLNDRLAPDVREAISGQSKFTVPTLDLCWIWYWARIAHHRGCCVRASKLIANSS